MLVYACLADGSEEVECLAVVDVLKRAGISVKLVSVMEDKTVCTAHGISITCDGIAAEVNFDEADVLFLPGGMPGTLHLGENRQLCEALQRHHAAGKHIAAICAAPSVLGKLGILAGKQATCYPGFEDQLQGAVYTRQGVVTDANVTTARGLGYALDLGLALVSILHNPEQAAEIKAAIQYET